MAALREEGEFLIGLTGDFVASDGEFYFEAAALAALRNHPKTSVQLIASRVGEPIALDALQSFDAIIAKRSPIDPNGLVAEGLRTIHLSRNGVGTEHLDLPACTRAGVIVTNTPDAVRRTMASSAMAMILALAHRLVAKDHATRKGNWSDRHRFKGIGLSGKVLGVIGAGNIGADLLRLATPWEMEHLVVQPSLDPVAARKLGAQKVNLDELLTRSDFIVLCCPLSEKTHHMIDRLAIERMKVDAHIVNIARGELIDEDALIAALKERRISGAALDVFEAEPPREDNPLFQLDNTIVSSHNIGFSDSGNKIGNTQAAEAVLFVADSLAPPNIVNPEALDHPRLRHLKERKETCAPMP